MTIDQIRKLVRKNILDLKPYSSARDEFKGKADVFLDANENPYGSPLENENYNRYPDPLQMSLKKEISSLKNVPRENIFIGNGSDEPIDILFRIFCEPGKDEILICPPTYGMYEVSANINDIAIQKVNLTKDFQLDTDKVLSTVNSKTKMIFICSPNNPSGNLMKQKDIETILMNFNGIVVLDEAYIDFAEEKSWIESLNSFSNLVILQTFSKAYGMAGLRIGMAFAHSEIISLMNKVKPPYNLNSYSIEKGIEAVRSKVQVNDWIREIKNEKLIIKNQLAQLSSVEEVYPSDANFILVKLKNAKEVYQKCAEQGIVLRDRSSQVNCENCLRITVGTPEENKKLITVLSKI